MKIDIEQLKTLIEAGDKKEIEKHILESALEKEDLLAAVQVNTEIKSKFESERDKYHTQALETWKTNNLDKLVEEEVNKRNPQETPEQKRIRELEEKLQKQERDAQRATLKEQALKYATEKGYDAKFATKWIDKLLADDEATTNTTLEEFKTDMDSIVQAQVDAKFKELGRDVEPGGASGGSNGSLDIASIAEAANIRK